MSVMRKDSNQEEGLQTLQKEQVGTTDGIQQKGGIGSVQGILSEGELFYDGPSFTNDGRSATEDGGGEDTAETSRTAL